MADIQHRSIADPDIHEPKGVGAASAGQIYVADGSTGGEWTSFTDIVDTTDTAWDDVVTPLSSVSLPAGISGPDIIKINDDGLGSTGVYAYGFDSSIEEEIIFTIQLPHTYKAGTDVMPHVHWVATTAAAGNVVWGLEYCISLNGVAANATTLMTVTDATPVATKTQQIAAWDAIDGTDLVESSIINCRLYRKAADVADTYAADAVAMSFDMHYQIEKLGTDNEYPGV